MLLKYFKTLVKHEDCGISVFLVVVSVLGNLIVQICIGQSLLFSGSSLASQFLNQQFLQLGGGLNIFSCFLVDTVVMGSLFLDVEFVEVKVGINILLQPVSGSILFSEDLVCEELFCSVVFSQLQA